MAVALHLCCCCRLAYILTSGDSTNVSRELKKLRTEIFICLRNSTAVMSCTLTETMVSRLKLFKNGARSEGGKVRSVCVGSR